MRFRPRPILAVPLAALLGFSVVLALLLQDGPLTHPWAFVQILAGQKVVPSAIQLRSVDDSAVPDAPRVHVLSLHVPVPSRLVVLDEVRFMMATYMASASLVGASLTLAGTGCVFTAPPDAVLVDNASLALRRGPGCQALPDTAPSLTAELRIESRGAPQVAVWAVTQRRDALFEVQTGSRRRARWLAPLGEYVKSSENLVPRSRLALLAYTWGLDEHQGSLQVAGLALAFALMAFGGMLLASSTRSLEGSSWRALLGGPLAIVGFGLAFAIIAPPFQTPDESDHFLSLSRLLGRRDLEIGALDLAQRGHFERLKFHPDEHFTAIDLGAPQTNPWAPHVVPPKMEKRAPFVARYWRMAGQLLGDAGPAEALFGMRVVDTLVMGALLALGLALALAAGIGAERASWLALAFLLAPTWPFFGMHLSNHSVMAAAYVLQAAGAVALIAGKRRPVAGGVAAGLGLALASLAGDAGLAMLVFWVTALLGALAVGGGEDGWRGRLLAFAGGALVAFEGAAALAGQGLPGPPFAFTQLSALVVRLKLWKAGDTTVHLVAGGLLAGGAALVAVLAVASPRIAGWFSRRLTRRLVLCAAVTFALFLVVTAVVPSRGLPDIEGMASPPSALSYARRAVVAFLRGLGLGEVDGYVVTTFWGGFGWLDAIPPDWLIRIARLVPTIGLAAALAAVRRSQQPQRLAPALWLGAGLVVYVAVLALAYHHIHYNLHGRYLLGAYALTLALASQGYPAFLATLANRVFATWTVLAAVVLAIGMHSAALTHLLLRYF
jgi:hypothetical protein